LLAKARALSTDPARHDEAAAHYRQLIESAGDEPGPALDAFEQFLKHAANHESTREHHRWLFEFRIERAEDPLPLLMDWAKAEEVLFKDLEQSAKLYERVVQKDPERTDALTELARLRALSGDAEGALASLEALRDRSQGEARERAQLGIAKLLLDPLGRPKQALAAAAETIERAPARPEALELSRRALGFVESRAQAARYLEAAANAFQDPAERARVLETLLAIADDSEDLRPARARWLKGLLAIKSEDPEGCL